ncbi:hypothetical protein Sste5346_001717 [Sporothrix stenoceras]|uniref:C2H2-type domain-containing protein n=1 Tax=Sporothrix stenoceras TaxID=5173 RepID=A0ABR3ZMY8_9PEZI
MAYRSRNSETVGILVDDITTSFEQASQLYGLWKSRRERSNHYRRPGHATTTLKTKTLQTNCALTTSLNLGSRTKETFSLGAAILGGTFTRGDNAGRRALAAQRDLIHDQVALLQKADNGPLDVNVILQASETVRVAAIQALVDQYRRMAADMDRRDVPRELPTPKWRSSSRQEFLRRESRDSRDERRESRGGRMSYNYNNINANKLSPSLIPPEGAPHRSRSPVPARAPIPAPIPVAPPPPVAPSARWLTYLEDDNRTTAWSVLSGPLVFQSEPPSPPLTPKELVLLPAQPPVPPLPEMFKAAAAKVFSLDAIVHPHNATHLHKRPPPQRPIATDLESAYNCGFGFEGHGPTGGSAKTGNSVNSSGGTSLVRPKNSVFHIFCPEAMALQVDVRRPLPSAAHKCRCGFRWEVGGDPKQMKGRGGPHQLKEGFGMSRRFLAKSHCEGADGGYGCVLCTSSGVAQTYETAEDLRTHINAAHDKWQMLHDRDLA